MSEQLSADEYRRLIQTGGGAATPKSKYRNVRVVVEGVVYDSKAEARYAAHLALLVRAGTIRGFDRQVPFPLIGPNGTVLGQYVVDFLIYKLDGTQELHDCKSPGTLTPLFKWKAKHVEDQYGHAVICIDSKTFQPFDY